MSTAQRHAELLDRLNTPGFDPRTLAREFVDLGLAVLPELQRKIESVGVLFGASTAATVADEAKALADCYANAFPLFEQAIDEHEDNERILSGGIESEAAEGRRCADAAVVEGERRVAEVDARLRAVLDVLAEACNTIDEHWRTRRPLGVLSGGAGVPGWFADAMALPDLRDSCR